MHFWDGDPIFLTTNLLHNHSVVVPSHYLFFFHNTSFQHPAILGKFWIFSFLLVWFSWSLVFSPIFVGKKSRFCWWFVSFFCWWTPDALGRPLGCSTRSVSRTWRGGLGLLRNHQMLGKIPRFHQEKPGDFTEFHQGDFSNKNEDFVKHGRLSQNFLGIQPTIISDVGDFEHVSLLMQIRWSLNWGESFYGVERKLTNLPTPLIFAWYVVDLLIFQCRNVVTCWVHQLVVSRCAKRWCNFSFMDWLWSNQSIFGFHFGRENCQSCQACQFYSDFQVLVRNRSPADPGFSLR